MNLARHSTKQIREPVRTVLSSGRAMRVLPSPSGRSHSTRRRTLDTAWSEPLDSWAISLSAAGRSPNTIHTRIEHLRMLGHWARPRTPWELTTHDLRTWLSHRPIALATLRSRYQSLCSFYDWATTSGRIATDPASMLDAPHIVIAPRPPISDEVLFEAWTNADERQRLILSLASEMGLRRGEIAAIHHSDLYRDHHGWVLRVHGKGRKTRDLPIPQPLDQHLYAATVTGGGWAFPSITGTHLTPRWVGTLISRLLPPGITMHQIRHRFAVILYRETKDVRLVQLFLGHENLATTQLYLDRHSTDLRTPLTHTNPHLRPNAHAYALRS